MLSFFFWLNVITPAITFFMTVYLLCRRMSRKRKRSRQSSED